jgi:hypothetical protein
MRMKNKWIWLVLAVVLLTSTTANGHYYKNEFLHVPWYVIEANDFFKVFLGHIRVIRATSSDWGPGTVHYYTILGVQFTFVRWESPNPLLDVSACDYIGFCVSTHSNPKWWRAICGVWTWNGIPVGWTGPLWWQWPWRRWINDAWRVTFHVQNGWKEYVGVDWPPLPDVPAVGDYIACPTIATEVHYALIDTLLPLEELNPDLWDGTNDPSWQTLTDLTLDPQQRGSWDLGDLDLDQVVLVRMVLADAGCQPDIDAATEIFQFQVGESIERADEIPTLSQWGLIILGVLLVGAATVLIVRRRRASLA